jgi:LAO/AO transport system kinase
LAGWARTTGDAVLVLDAAGFDVVLIETVGVGQDEVEVAQTADATVVVLVPGTGDDVQAMKAGIMEIADVFVANKADREGIDRLVQTIEAALSLQPAVDGAWTPPVLKTEATTGAGVPELWDALGRFRDRSEALRRAAPRSRARAHSRPGGGDAVRTLGEVAAGGRVRAGGGRGGCPPA